VLHELFHVLGGVNSDGVSKVTSAGSAVSTADIAQTGISPFNTATELITMPTVLAKAKEQFACDTLEGVPLEDSPSGAGLHWEARVMGTWISLMFECLQIGSLLPIQHGYLFFFHRC